MRHSSDKDFKFSMQIRDIFKNPEINYGYIENLPLHNFTDRKWVEDNIKKYQLEGILVGPINNMRAEISCYAKDHEDNRFILTSQIDNILHSEKSIVGQLSYKDFKSLCTMKLGPDYLKAKVISNKSFRGNLDIDLLSEQQVNAEINFTQFQLNQLFTDS